MPDLDDDLAFLFADAAAQQQQALSDGGQHHHPHDQHPPESFYDGQTAFSGEDYEPSKSEEPGGGPSGGSAAAAAAAAEGKRLRKSQRQPLSYVPLFPRLSCCALVQKLTCCARFSISAARNVPGRLLARLTSSSVRADPCCPDFYQPAPIRRKTRFVLLFSLPGPCDEADTL